MLLANNRSEIESRKVRVFLIDECHLMWGDLSGYVWGKTDQEIAVPSDRVVILPRDAPFQATK